MKKFFIFSLLATVAMVLNAATATFSNGRLTLDFAGDWAVIDEGNRDISVVDGEGIQLATIIGDCELDANWTAITYQLAGRLDPGQYTVKVADGAILGDKTDPFSWNLVSIGALELPLTVEESGDSEDSETASLGTPEVSLLAGSGVNVKFTYPDSCEPENYVKQAAEGKIATLLEDGVEVATADFGFKFSPVIFYGAHFDYTIVEGKQYKVVFPAGCWYIVTLNNVIVTESPEVSYSWVGGEQEGMIEDDQPGTDQPGDDQPGNEPESPVKVDFKIGSSLAALTNNMVVADITVDRAYYDIYWTITCASDPDFFFGGSSHAASEGAGTYTIIASTPSAEPVVLNSGRTYTFTFQTCEFGWDGYNTVGTFDVAGAGAAAEQFSDITIVDFDGTMGALGYNFKNTYTVTFSAPVTNVKAFAALGMDGDSNFGVTAADNVGLKWKIDVSSMANEEGGFELHITAVDAATGLRLLGTYHLDNSFIYTISVSTNTTDDEPGTDPELPSEELEIASIAIDGNVIMLSETKAIELAAYPEGALFLITLADEAIKKVSYEIVDNTANEIYKSVADLEQGEDGLWKAVMPRTYVLAAGHEYSIHVVARDGMSSFTSNILYEYNFLVNGTSNVATYSHVKLVRLYPSEDMIITEAQPVITVAFSEPIASLSASAVIGQQVLIAIPAANIVTDDYTTWSINIPADAIADGALSLDVVAIDNNGNRVTDAQYGVGTPTNCYLSFGWAATIDLPTPELAENGTTVDAITALHFTYEGIGLNVDNATATWNQISITRDGEILDIEITESMFSIDGDNSVGGTELVLTLNEALTEAGTYTISVPAYAFMLGHDQYNYYNGACEFTVTVSAVTGIATVNAAGNGAIYGLNGVKADRLVSGSLYIQNGQKVIVK